MGSNLAARVNSWRLPMAHQGRGAGVILATLLVRRAIAIRPRQPLRVRAA